MNFAVHPNTRLDDVDSDLFVLKYDTHANREEKNQQISIHSEESKTEIRQNTEFSIGANTTFNI